MTRSLRRPLSAALGAALVGGALVLGAPTATAQADPLVGLCAASSVDEINGLLSLLDSEQLAALAPLLTITVPSSTDDGVLVLDAGIGVDDVRTALDCGVETPDPEPTPDPTPEPTPEPTPSTDATPEPSADPTPADRDCVDFALRSDAQAAYDAARTATDPDPLGLDRDGDGIACEVEDVTTVDPIADDGSTADVDGSQVTVVPEGSVDTGAA